MSKNSVNNREQRFAQDKNHEREINPLYKPFDVLLLLLQIAASF
jgi:hypothetical protein